MTSYSEFCDDLMLVLAERAGQGQQSVDLTSAANEANLVYEPTWIQKAANEFKANDYGAVLQGAQPQMMINGGGLRRVEEIKESRRPLTFTEKLTTEKSQKLVNVWGLAFSGFATVISAVALYVSCLAYLND